MSSFLLCNTYSLIAVMLFIFIFNGGISIKKIGERDEVWKIK